MPGHESPVDIETRVYELGLTNEERLNLLQQLPINLINYGIYISKTFEFDGFDENLPDDHFSRERDRAEYAIKKKKVGVFRDAIRDSAKLMMIINKIEAAMEREDRSRFLATLLYFKLHGNSPRKLSLDQVGDLMKSKVADKSLSSNRVEQYVKRFQRTLRDIDRRSTFFSDPNN